MTVMVTVLFTLAWGAATAGVVYVVAVGAARIGVPAGWAVLWAVGMGAAMVAAGRKA